jgi:hypothetical protein
VAPAPDGSFSHLKPDHRNWLPLLPWKAQGSPVDLELGTSLLNGNGLIALLAPVVSKVV